MTVSSPCTNIIGWLVVFRINVDLAIFQPYLDLEAGDNQSLNIRVARPGIKLRSSCSASQELNQSTTAAPCTKRKFKKAIDNTKTPPKTLITQRLRTDLRRSDETVQLVLLNRFTGTQPSHWPQKLCTSNQKDTHLKFVNTPPYHSS